MGAGRCFGDDDGEVIDDEGRVLDIGPLAASSVLGPIPSAHANHSRQSAGFRVPAKIADAVRAADIAIGRVHKARKVGHHHRRAAEKAPPIRLHSDIAVLGQCIGEALGMESTAAVDTRAADAVAASDGDARGLEGLTPKRFFRRSMIRVRERPATDATNVHFSIVCAREIRASELL